MGKSIVEEAKESVKNKKKEENKMKNQSLKETVKTILLTILITGIVAFVGGMQYEKGRTAEIQKTAQALTASVQTVEVKK